MYAADTDERYTGPFVVQVVSPDPFPLTIYLCTDCGDVVYDIETHDRQHWAVLVRGSEVRHAGRT
jgi:hypothetical protein